MEIATNILSVIELQPEKIPNWMVIVMGIGVVFVGLIAIIILCKIMGLFFISKAKTNKKAAEVKPAPAVQSAVVENRQEIIAAITAVCAEEMGKDVSAIRVISFKKI